jgi:putative two-component system hydrogenase maturation factor HypX/HoxX
MEFCAIAEIKLPATQVLGPSLRGVPEAPLPIDAPNDHRTFREIVYSEEGQVGYLSFDFYNGAMSTAQCYRLRDAFLYARSRPTRVIALLGGPDFWSNGIHLNAIEASINPADQSWRNINAIDDLILDILNTMSHLVIAGLRGNAGASGAMLALAADRAYAMSGVVLNPHYRSMGELYGSEYWTYTLPRRVGQARAIELTQACKPLGARAAREMGFLDDAFGEDAKAFEAELRARATRLAQDPEFRAMLRKKHESRLDDENIKPLASYRAEELDRMKVNFFGSDPAYHESRRRFVFKGDPPPQSGAPVSAQNEPSQDMLGKAIARPTPEDISWSAPSRGAYRSAHVPELEPDESPALTGAAWRVRLLGMLRRKVAAVHLRRDQ